MTENELFRAIFEILNKGMASRGLSDVVAKRNYQSRQEGRAKGRALYVYKIGPSRNHGSPQRKDEWDKDNERMVHTERQKKETTFQVTAQADPAPEDIKALTAGDIADIAAAVMQSDATIAFFRAKNVGIFRITEVRNPQFTNDKDQFEASPSFDFTLTHDMVHISETPAIETYEFNVQRI